MDKKINSKQCIYFQNVNEILHCLQFGTSTKKYSEAIRSFCLQVHFHSPAAYCYIRKAFNNNLPRIATIIAWYSSIDGSPGFKTEYYDVLRKKVQEFKAKENNQHKDLFVVLMSDEMAINQKLQWNNVTKRFIGFATYTNSKKNTSVDIENYIPLGKQALVFMVVGEDFKLALSYFLLNGISSEDRADLTREVILRINETGAKVMAFTSDGFVGNIACTKILGADFDVEKPYFLDPSDPTRKIYVIWDACHMLKLGRNCFGSKQLYHNDEAIRWDLISNLHNLQSRSIVKLGNKIGQTHINWRNRPMNVRIAAETLSDGVANSLQQLYEDGIPGFENSGATIEYIRVVNNIFDIMNSRKKNQEDAQNFKRAMSPETKQEYFEYFAYVKGYLKNLVMEQVTKNKKKNIVTRNSVFATKSHTAFFGLYNNIIAFEGLYMDYVENGLLDVLYTFQFSQDHLETYFGTIRRIQGCSDNPTPIQIAGAFRKLLVCNGILASQYSNTISDETPVLTASSRIKSKAASVDLRAIKEVEIGDFDYYAALNENVPKCDKHFNAILASTIELEVVKHIKLCSKKACQKCADAFLEDYVIHNALIDKQQTHGMYVAPAQSTYDIVKVSNKIITLIDNQACNLQYEVSHETVLKTIMGNLDIDALFSQTKFEEHRHSEPHQMTHKEAFISKIIQSLLKVKSEYVSKLYDEELKKIYIRHKLVKLIHLAGQ